MDFAFELEPINNLKLLSNTGTNFKSFSNLTLLNYNYNWTKTKEFININNEIKIIPNKYSEIFNEGLFSYNFNFRGKHISNIDISIIKNLIFLSKNKYIDTLNINLSKNLIKNLNLNIGFNNNSTEYFTNNIIQISLSSSYFIPLSFNYNYDFNNKGYELNISSNFINNQNINSFFSLVKVNKYSLIYNRNIEFININLNSYFKINDDFSFYFRSMYDSFQNNILLGSSLSYNLFNNSKIEFEINNPNITKNNYNVSVSYTYDFSENRKRIKNLIEGKVFEDINEDSIINDKERNIKNIKLVLENNENKKKYETISDDSGFKFENIENGNYTLSILEESLPEGYRLLSYSKEEIYLNNSRLEINFAITNLLKISGTIFGNKSKTYGLSNIKIILDDKEEVYTDSEGRFIFKTNKGNHKVRIDFLSIPNQYILNDSFIKEIYLNEDKNIDFVFYPLRVIKGNILKNNKYLSNYKFEYKYSNSEKVYNIETNNKGEFIIKVDEDDDIELLINKQKYLINIPEKPQEININLNI
ncbi:MAG: hypothetical protein KatS3mg068_1120 [Candidatus Sericytochromatia bacterium]|nr:MAG: hypothetical protein KatS3mg068_1120 [Candidatus Sericytochromatia bacterium]